MKSKILALLRESGDYLSGQELCERFGVSRTAVWKAIGQLKQDGYPIEAVKNRGYKLLAEPDIFNKSEIESRMNTKWAGRNTVYFNSTDSTNIRAGELAGQGAVHGTLVVADRQTGGLGRRGRSWESPEGVNLYFTLLLRPDFHPSKASMLTVLMAEAAADAMEKAGIEGLKIKWPNDIVLNGKKVCGILTEMNAEPDCIHFVMIGTGINIGQKTFPEELKEKATSVLLETGTAPDRAQLLCMIMKEFERVYEEFLQTENLSGIRDDYEKRLVNKNREVRVLDPKGEYTALAKGINENGELLVTDEEGKEHSVYAGEVSVRGIYGYV